MKNKEKSRGQSVVELALILPIVIVLLLGLIEFGRALFIYTVVSNSAREGARFGIVFPRDQDGIRSAVERRLMLVPTDTVTINISYDLCNDPCNGDGSNTIEGQSRVIVNVRSDFSMVTPIIRDLFPQTTIEFTSARTIVYGARARKTPVPPPPPVCDVPLTGVSISGPTEGEVGEDLTFVANPLPANATPPITYVWSPVPKSGQGTATAVYNWSTSGGKTIQVTAQNCGGTPHTDNHAVTINPPSNPPLVITFHGLYPCKKINNDHIRVLAYVTADGNPVNDATVDVTIDAVTWQLSYIGISGYYGSGTSCWESPSKYDSDRDVTVTASKTGHAGDSETANTSGKQCNSCPWP